MFSRAVVVTVLMIGWLPKEAAAQPTADLADAIRREATRPNRGDAGRPLPLVAHWNVTGMYNEGFTPAYQQQLLAKGHHLLPWIEYPPTDWNLDRLFKPNDPRRQKYI